MKTLWLGAMCLAACGVARAQTTILSYTFAGNTANAAVVNSNVTASAISTNGTVSISNSSPVASGYSGASGSYYAADNGWGTSANFFQLSITPNPGQSVLLSSIVFGYRTSSSSGPTGFSLKSSVDGYTSAVASGTLTNADTAWHAAGPASITLSAITAATTLRLYATGASTNTPTLRIDDLIITGSATAIPEPSAYVAILGMLALMGAITRRYRAQPAA